MPDESMSQRGNVPAQPQPSWAQCLLHGTAEYRMLPAQASRIPFLPWKKNFRTQLHGDCREIPHSPPIDFSLYPSNFHKKTILSKTPSSYSNSVNASRHRVNCTSQPQLFRPRRGCGHRNWGSLRLPSRGSCALRRSGTVASPTRASAKGSCLVSPACVPLLSSF